MKNLLNIIPLISLIGITNIGIAEATPEKASIQKDSKSSYSVNPETMSLMERQLKEMLKQKLLKTPKVDPNSALPPLIIGSDSSSDTEQPAQDFFEQLIAAAKQRTLSKVRYDGSYRYISYPMGDIAPDRGVCTDVIIRSYRKLGIDLQQLVHEDIKKHFHLYPSHRKWGNTEPDTNIDHRRVYNLQVFFQRHAKSLPITQFAEDYQPGDLVTWQLAPKMPHIGIVIDKLSDDYPNQHLVVHNIGEGPKQEDILFSFPITGHYRFKPDGVTTPKSLPAPTIFAQYEEKEAPQAVNSLVEAAYLLLP